MIVAAAAGKHLAHVAASFGEAQEGPPGWLGRRKKLWALPEQLRPFAEVSTSTLFMHAAPLCVCAVCLYHARNKFSDWKPSFLPVNRLSAHMHAFQIT
jgi:hypothetical protein